jgi:hypothetical protein
MLEDILSESWAFQDIMKKGWDKGWEESEQEELQQTRQTLYVLIEARFPDLVTLTKEKTNDIKNTKELHELIIQAGTARNADEMQQYLLTSARKHES